MNDEMNTSCMYRRHNAQLLRFLTSITNKRCSDESYTNPNLTPVGAGSVPTILKHKRNMMFYGHNEKVQFVPEPEPIPALAGPAHLSLVFLQDVATATSPVALKFAFY
jgi:hypothetical protein